MSLAVKKSRSYPAITMVSFIRDRMIATLDDGREVSVPLAWFPALLNATPETRNKFKIAPGGYGVHWPDIDEDISIKAFLE